MQFTKPPLPIAQQISLLKSRGLRINNEKEAEHHLKNISYYRLSAYFQPFQKYNDPLHTFMPWATFKRIMNLYRFDRELRVILMDPIERIEIALRCKIIYEYSIRHGSHWFDDTHLYVRDYNKIQSAIVKELDRTREVFIDHYKNKYTYPPLPPSWMTLETLSLGQLSKMFKSLINSDAKKAVAIYFGIHHTILESWIEHLTYIRNICAHHGRLWNRILIVAPTVPRNTTQLWITRPPLRNDKIYLSICIVAYMLKRITPTSNIKGKLLALINRLPSTDLRAAGFPSQWRNDLFWKEIFIPWSYKARIIFFQCRNLSILR